MNRASGAALFITGALVVWTSWWREQRIPREGALRPASPRVLTASVVVVSLLALTLTVLRVLSTAS